jgi:diaminopimelate decarboxylase
LGGVRLVSLVERFGSPLFVVDAARLADNAEAFRHVPPGAKGGVECYYSYKTNPVPGVLRRLHAAGLGAEVISEYELWLARKLGVAGERIVVNGPGLSQPAVRMAMELGALIHLNQREAVRAVAETARSLGKRARVGLRVALPSGWGGQFGEPVATALSTYDELLSRPELDVVALHAHIGGELSNVPAVEDYIRALLDFCRVLRRELRFVPAILDVGGSVPCRTVSPHGGRALRLNRSLGVDLEPRKPEAVIGIREYVDVIVRAVEESCAREGWNRPRIFVEPGRAVTSNAQLLLCRISTLKASGADGLIHAVLDAGINVAEPLRGEYHEIFVATPKAKGERTYRLVGPICTPMDTLTWARRLPELAPGDVLSIMDAGAYFVPFSTSFSFPQPGVAWIESHRATLIRRPETFEDLVRRDLDQA